VVGEVQLVSGRCLDSCPCSFIPVVERQWGLSLVLAQELYLFQTYAYSAYIVIKDGSGTVFSFLFLFGFLVLLQLKLGKSGELHKLKPPNGLHR